GTSADTGNEDVRQAVLFLEDLAPGFITDYTLEIAHHERVRMRAVNCAQDVMGGADMGDPIAHRFVDGLLQSLLACFDRNDPCTEHFHAENIERLPFTIDRPHVNHTFEPEHRRHSGGSYTVLASASFGNNASLAHATCKKDLADAIVDFVRAGMEQV